MDHRSEMSPVVVYALIIETKGGDGGEDEGGGGRRLSTHYVTSHPLTNEKKNQHHKSKYKYTDTLGACSTVSLMRVREKKSETSIGEKKSSR
jgi:hypothetical protein